MNKEQSPEELLNAVSRHDVAALSELYDRYSPRLCGLISHMLPLQPAAAEEVLQELFLRLWSGGAGLGLEGRSVVAWLVVTARAMALDRLRDPRQNGNGDNPQSAGPQTGNAVDDSSRKKQTRPAKAVRGNEIPSRLHPRGTAAKPTARNVPPAWLPLPKEITLIDDRLPLLHKAVNQLPASQRKALDLAVYGGRSEAEIAIEMGEPLGKAQRSLRAAVTFVKHRRRTVCGTWTANI